jgi:regulator of protease activity HflC (stomatin/prohibitin superfamily)
LFWKGVVHVRAEIVDASGDGEVPARVVQTLLRDLQAHRASPFKDAVYVREVPESHAGLLYIEGRLVRDLAPGIHAFWQIGRRVAIEILDARVKALEVGGEEILTKDKASLRVHLNASYRFADALLTMRTVRDPIDFLYREIRQGLRNAVAQRSLDALLEDKTALDKDVFENVQRKFAPLGIDIRDIGVNELAKITL